MSSKNYLFLCIISIINKISFIVVSCFLLYLMLAIPSFSVPFDNNFYYQIDQSSFEELIKFSKQIVHWIEISNNTIHSLSTIVTLVMILLFSFICINYLLLRTIIYHLKQQKTGILHIT